MKAEDDNRATSSDNHESFRLPNLSLRFLVLPLSAASLWALASDKQSSDAYGKVAFSDLSGLKYLVCVSAISLVYAVASLLLSSFRLLKNDWIPFIADQVMTYLMVTAGAAVAELLYLAKEGDREVSWSEVCSYYDKFCSRIKVSLGLHFAATVCFIALSLISAHRVFSKFEAPIVPSKEVVEQGQEQ